MFIAQENIPTTIHAVPDVEPILDPLVAGEAVTCRTYKFGRHDRVAYTRVISSNPNAPTGRYQHQY